MVGKRSSHGLKAGFIGYMNFAKTLSGLFEENGATKEFLFFHPEKEIENADYTNKIGDLFGCDFIVIASPDDTHGQYIRQLQKYDGYVFCEKIPVTNHDDLGFLKKHPNPRMYFDFCYRKSRLRTVLEENAKKILHIDHKCCHGLAMKEEYRNNWRSSASRAPLGVFQLSGIHFFDLLVFCFGKPASYYWAARNFSPYGDSVDNFSISLEFKNKVTASVFCSYTSPYCFSTKAITADSLIEIDEEQLRFYGPRETFDGKGRFAAPGIVSKEKISLYKDSLKNSVDYFVKTVRSGGDFQEAHSENNLLSTELFLEIQDKAGKKAGVWKK